jgi:Type VI secretion system (T6SS), amidase effector protein 4
MSQRPTPPLPPGAATGAPGPAKAAGPAAAMAAAANPSHIAGAPSRPAASAATSRPAAATPQFGGTLRFAELWPAYPEGHPSEERYQEDVLDHGVVIARKGELKYPDQCAIKVSVALHRAGVDMADYRGASTLIDGKRAALRAAELAAWLDRQQFGGAAASSVHAAGAGWQARMAGRTGIIYFANYWRRAGESAPTGDHIDLWNRDTLTPSIESFLRFRLGIDHLPNPLARLRGASDNWYSRLDDATEVVLWEIA